MNNIYIYIYIFLRIFICLFCTYNVSLHCIHTKNGKYYIHLPKKKSTNFANVYDIIQFLCVYNINLHCKCNVCFYIQKEWMGKITVILLQYFWFVQFSLFCWPPFCFLLFVLFWWMHKAIVDLLYYFWFVQFTLFHIIIKY